MYHPTPEAWRLCTYCQSEGLPWEGHTAPERPEYRPELNGPEYAMWKEKDARWEAAQRTIFVDNMLSDAF